MVLTIEELQEIQSNLMCDDITLADHMLGWTVDEATAYFESGGFAVPTPTVQPDKRPDSMPTTGQVRADGFQQLSPSALHLSLPPKSSSLPGVSALAPTPAHTVAPVATERGQPIAMAPSTPISGQPAASIAGEIASSSHRGVNAAADAAHSKLTSSGVKGDVQPLAVVSDAHAAASTSSVAVVSDGHAAASTSSVPASAPKAAAAVALDPPPEAAAVGLDLPSLPATAAEAAAAALTDFVVSKHEVSK